MGIHIKLANIQSKLNAPKNQRNNFGNYNYRSCEDILQAVKPYLTANQCTVNISDKIELIGDRFYVVATATIVDAETNESVSTTAYAREEQNKKGMDVAQITGAASSYARKYALSGLLAIDNNDDPDATNTHGKDEEQVVQQPTKPVKPEWYDDKCNQLRDGIARLASYTNMPFSEIKDGWWNKVNGQPLEVWEQTINELAELCMQYYAQATGMEG